MKQKPRIRQVSEIARSRLFRIEQLDLEFSNGSEASFERIRANAGRAVMVAAITDQQEILLVSEYAAGTERYELQLPKGIVEHGEISADAANRELAEETGFAATEVQLIHTLRVSPGYFQHETDVMLARGLYPKQIQTGDEPEPPDLHRFPLSDVDTLLKREDFSEARSIAALLMVLRMLDLS